MGTASAASASAAIAARTTVAAFAVWHPRNAIIAKSIDISAAAVPFSAAVKT